MQSKESVALQTLADFRHTDKPLPELVPFPFKPDKYVERPKSCVTVPTPSKFIKGTMYHSDYESDLEGPIPSKWRSGYYSDTDGNNRIHKYRKIKPKLVKKNENTSSERKPSPPCPHKWESHETIEKLEQQLRTPGINFLEQAKLLRSSKISTKLESTTIITQDSTKLSKTSSGNPPIRDHPKMIPTVVREPPKKEVINNTDVPTYNTISGSTTINSTAISSINDFSNEEKKTVTSSFISNQQTKIVSNDKAPEFEAVNFQTYDNPDGTKHHILDISDDKTSSCQTAGQTFGNDQTNLMNHSTSNVTTRSKENVDNLNRVICTETKKISTMSDISSSINSNFMNQNKISVPIMQSQTPTMVPPSPPPPFPSD